MILLSYWRFWLKERGQRIKKMKAILNTIWDLKKLALIKAIFISLKKSYSISMFFLLIEHLFKKKGKKKGRRKEDKITWRIFWEIWYGSHCEWGHWWTSSLAPLRVLGFGRWCPHTISLSSQSLTFPYLKGDFLFLLLSPVLSQLPLPLPLLSPVSHAQALQGVPLRHRCRSHHCCWRHHQWWRRRCHRHLQDVA